MFFSPAYANDKRSVITTVLLCMLIACNSIPLFRLTFEPGIDGPLPWVFNYFADGHFDKARQLLFPHGPLAFLLYPLAVGNNLVAAVLITIVCSAILAFNLFSLFQSVRDKIVMAVIILFFESFLDIQLLIFAIALSFLLLHDTRPHRNYITAAVFFTVFNLFIKTYGGAISLLLLGGFAVHLLIKKNFRQLLMLFFSFVVIYLLWWFCLFRTVDGVYDFLRGQVELSGGNSDAALYFQVNDWPLISISFLALALIPLLVADEKARFLCLLLLLPLFGAWKHAMSRGDGQHVNGYLNFLVLILFMLLVFTQKHRLRAFVLACAAVGAFLLNMGVTASYNEFEEQKTVAAVRAFNLYKFTVQHDSVVQQKKRQNDALNARALLPGHLRNLIGKQTVDIYPWNYSIIAMNRLNWMPRPTLHPYAMYSKWLDQKNAAHLASGNSAHYILWEIKELGGRYLSIDNRYLLNDGPQVTEALMSCYRLVYKDDLYFLYEKQNAVPYKKMDLTQSKKHRFMQWFDVPACDSTEILRARIDIRYNVTGTLKSQLFKGEGFHLSMELGDGQVVDHKLVPQGAREGMLVNPLIRYPGENKPEPRVKRLRVFCTDTSHVKPEFEVQFEKLNFGTYDFRRHFYGKEKDTTGLNNRISLSTGV